MIDRHRDSGEDRMRDHMPSDFELAPASVRGKSSIRVTFRPRGGPWSIGELRAFSHVERPLEAK